MSETIVHRPRRWDEPFGDTWSDENLDRILASPHFAGIDADAFPKSLPLRDILRNDARLRHFSPDQLIVPAGAYINAVFLTLSGSAKLILAPGIDPAAWGQIKAPRPSVLATVGNWLSRPKYPEVRDYSKADNSSQPPGDDMDDMPFISDLDMWISKANVETLDVQPGDFFGASAVLGRTEMTYTVVSQSELEVLEIRWQGLRDIGRYAPKFKKEIETVYRDRGLFEHLISLPLFENIPREKIHDLANNALFEVHGEFDWQKSFQRAAKQAETEADYDRLIEAEPVIVKEGDYPDGLLLILDGFARISRYVNHGQYTFGHLANGDIFGLQELYDSWLSSEPQPLRCSLRALGYTDIIRIPTQWLEDNVFAQQETGALRLELERNALQTTMESDEGTLLDRKFTEFLVENRVINGTKTMVIDLERCVRCDDCVTACANAHDNNPRFVRHGPVFEKYMIANACMHCDDPVCMIGCPTGAIHRQSDGTVTINDKTCIGCSTCANSCPYDNIRMVPIRDKSGKLYTDEKSVPIVKATKCDLCSQVPGGPACQRACPHDALIRLDVKDQAQLSDWINR